MTDVLTETYGRETADQIQKTIRDSTARQYLEAASYSYCIRPGPLAGLDGFNLEGTAPKYALKVRMK